ncbi:MAG: hypothetical protein A3B66_09255 [Alphaproteobacteria bacterium RIFCSPHIGHO2_02_FULL_46_13]|nr:MAG: hypothetical protein A3B66_09255 [Alphaproteobacteria bacterium RIFCSPHIGHO2_02_FULL_46_13]
MTVKSVFIGCVTALFGLVNAGCATSASDPKEAARVAGQLPDYTTTDPKTGCRYFKDEKNPNKPQPCIIDDSPKLNVK